MKKIIIGASVAAILVSSYAGVALYARSKVATLYTEAASAIAQKYPEAQISHKILEQGLFSSKVEVTVRFGCDKNAKEAFKYTDTITHGPVLGTHGFGAMYISTDITLDAASQAKISKIFGKDKPLEIGTKIGFGGGATVKLSSPAKNFTDEESKSQVKWAGLEAELNASNPSKIQITGLDFIMPELTITEADNKGSFSLKEAKANMKSTGTTSELGLGSGELSIQSITVQSPNKNMNILANNLKIGVESNASGDFMDINESINLNNVKVNARDYGPISYKVILKHLHIPSLIALQKDMDAAKALACSDPSASAEGIKTALTKNGATLLAKIPEVVVESLKAKFPEGEASFTGKASIPTFVETDLNAEQGYAALMGKVTAEGKLIVPEAVAKYFASLSSPNNAADFDKNSAMAIEAGAIVRQGNDFVIDAKWANGSAMINGHPQAEIMQKLQAAAMKNIQQAPAPEGMEKMTPEQQAQVQKMMEEMAKQQAAQ